MYLLKWLLGGIIGLAVIWYFLTLYVQQPGRAFSEDLLSSDTERRALFVFDPDPFYNLDEKLCMSFARAIKDFGFNAYLRSPNAVGELKDEEFDLLVLCTNTYNWAPDDAVRDFWRNYPDPQDQRVVLMTLGGGSTARARQIMEKAIQERNAQLLASEEFWSWKPNDEDRMDEKNSEVAQEVVHQWASAIAGDHF